MRKDVSIRTQVKAWVKADGKVVVHFENLHFTIVKGYINCLLVVLFFASFIFILSYIQFLIL